MTYGIEGWKDGPRKASPEKMMQKYAGLLNEIQRLLKEGILRGGVGTIMVRPNLYSPNRYAITKFAEASIRPQVWDQQVLMVYSNKRKTWGNPAGHLETTDASILEGLAREVREETGIELFDLIDLLDIDVNSHENSGNGNKVQLLFQTQVSPAVQFDPIYPQDPDVGASVWLDPLQALQLAEMRRAGGENWGELFTYDYLQGWNLSFEERMEMAAQNLQEIINS